MNLSVTRRCSADSTSKRAPGWPSATFCLARLASCRHDAGSSGGVVRWREQQQPDRRRAARGPLDVQDQGGRRHRVAERADGLGRQQPGQPRRPPYQRERH
jgi:hypothetical protein